MSPVNPKNNTPAAVSQAQSVGCNRFVKITTHEVRPGTFAAWLGVHLLCTSRQPLLDGARRLLEAGFPPDAMLVMRGPDGVERLRTTVTVAARLTVRENQH